MTDETKLRDENDQQEIIRSSLWSRRITWAADETSQKLHFLPHFSKQKFWLWRQKKVQRLKHLLSDAFLSAFLFSLFFMFFRLFRGRIMMSTMCNTKTSSCICCAVLCCFCLMRKNILDTWKQFRIFWDFSVSLLTSAFDFSFNPHFNPLVPGGAT